MSRPRSATQFAVFLVAVAACLSIADANVQGQQAGKQGTMRSLPDRTDEDSMQQLVKRREAALKSVSENEASYIPCIARARSRRAAQTCLASWESAVATFDELNLALFTELVRQDNERIRSWQSQVGVIAARTTQLQNHPTSMSMDSLADAYRQSLELSKKNLAEATQANAPASTIVNLTQQVEHLESALGRLDAAKGNQGRAFEDLKAAQRDYSLILERERAILKNDTAGLDNAMMMAQGTADLKLAREGQVDLVFPPPPPPPIEEVCIFCPYVTMESCLAETPSKTYEQCRGKHRIAFKWHLNAADCKRKNPSLTDSQCGSLVRK